jgi:hypothetical protein
MTLKAEMAVCEKIRGKLEETNIFRSRRESSAPENLP